MKAPLTQHVPSSASSCAPGQSEGNMQDGTILKPVSPPLRLPAPWSGSPISCALGPSARRCQWVLFFVVKLFECRSKSAVGRVAIVNKTTRDHVTTRISSHKNAMVCSGAPRPHCGNPQLFVFRDPPPYARSSDRHAPPIDFTPTSNFTSASLQTNFSWCARTSPRMPVPSMR